MNHYQSLKAHDVDSAASSSYKLLPWLSDAASDALALSVAGGALFAASYELDAFEHFVVWSESHEDLHSGAVVTALTIILISLLIFSFRRLQESRREYALRRQSDEELRLRDKAVMASISAICFATPDGNITYVNDMFLKLWGFKTPKEVIGTNVASLHPDRDSFNRGFAEFTEFGSYDGEIQGIRKDGTHFDLKVSAGSLLNSAGKPLYIMAFFHDMTHRKRAYEALRKSEEKLRLITENIEEVFWLCNPDVSEIVYISPSFEKLWGTSCKSLYESPTLFIDSIHPDDRERILNGLVQHAEGQWNHEYRIVLPDGTFRWIQDRGFPIRDGAGNITMMTGTAQNITERKLAEEAIIRARDELELRVMERTAELSLSMRRYQDLVESTPDWVWEIDEEWRYTYVSPRAINLLGFGPEEILGKTPFDFMEEKDAQELSELFSVIARSREPLVAVQNTNIQKDGSRVILETNAIPFFDLDGAFKGYRGIDLDITDRKKAQEKLEENISLLNSTLESTADGILVVDLHGIMTAYNSKFLELWGIPEDVAQTRSDAGAITSVLCKLKDPDAFVDKVNRMYAEPDSTSFDVLEFKDGRVFERYSQPQRIGDRIVGRVWSFRNITDRKAAERALVESERRFKELAELLPQTAFEFGIDGKFWYVNSAGLELTGYTPDEFYNCLTPVQMIAEKDRARGAENIKKLIAGEKVSIKPYTGLKKDGTEVPILIYTVPISRNEQVVGLRGIMIDLSPVKKAEEERDKLRTQLFQSQKLESLGTLVGGIAHDFNNMLQIIIGYSEILQDVIKMGESGEKEINTIIKTGQEGAALVRKLLAFGQQGQVFPMDIDLNDQINQLSIMISRTLSPLIKLKTDLVEGPTIIRADPGQIEQVVMNLAINASEAMPKGGSLTVTSRVVMLGEDDCGVHVDSKPGKYVMLSIADTGNGMDQSTLSKVFDPFFSTKQRGAARGTGLGLSVVRGIAQQIGGFVTCGSSPGNGTEFKIYFPAIEISADKHSVAGQKSRPGESGTILVVEDSDITLELEQKVLQSQGYTVIGAKTGLDAVRIFGNESKNISLVILDLLMPEMSGRDCLLELVRMDPSVKVLIASGFSPENELRDEIMPLVRGFLHKPCTMDEFLQSVENVLADEPFHLC